ncbi:MAG: TRAP transporter small permease [Paracoccaceae bacterium]|nr:TRAP transporter small permease [Paracoccaceae bacterium]
MDEKTLEQVSGRGPLGGIWAFIVARPDNERVTGVDRVMTVISRLSMFLVLLGVAITFYEVFMRYIFASPTLWVNEMTLWLGAMIYLLAGAYTMQRRAHIRITAVYDIVSKRTRFLFDHVALFVIIVYAVMMFVGGYDVAWEAFITWERFGTVFDPPIPATIKPLVLIVTLLVGVMALNNLLVDWFGFGKSETERSAGTESDR